MSTAKQVNAFVRVTLVPVTGDTVLWQASTRPLADPPSYWDGKKPGLIEAFGDVERALSDNRGAYEVPTFSFVTDDRTGYWRGLLADPNTQYLTSSDVMFLLISEEGRHTLVDPRTEFRGQLERPAPLPGKKFQVNAQSRLGTRYGPIDLQSPVNKAKFTLEDWPELPRDNENKTVPALWGEESDSGITNAAEEEVSVGRVIPILCGPVFQGSTPGAPPTSAEFLPDPPALTYTLYGSGGSTTWTYAASVRTASGHTRLGATVTIPNLPSEGHFTGEASGWSATPTNGVALHLAQYAANLQAQVVGADLWVKLGAADSSSAWHKVDAAGEMFNTIANEVFNGGAGYMDNGDDSHFKPSPAPPTTNTAQVTAGTPGIAPNSLFYDFWCLLRFPGKITKVYATNLAEEPVYAAISASEIGVDYTSGKQFLFGPDGTGVTLVRNNHTYWGFFAKGPKNEAAKSGAMPFRVNFCGRHQGNDTSNPIIDQAALVYQDVLTQMGGNNGEGWQDGPELTIPTFANFPTNPILQSTTFAATQDVTKLYLGDDKGYVTCVYIDDDRTWGSFVQQMDDEYQFDLGEDCHGQFILTIMSDMVLPTDGIVLRERTHIKVVNDAGIVADDEIENYTDYEYDRHPILGKYMSGIKNIKNDVSIAKYGKRTTPSTREMLYTRDPATADDANKRYHLHRIVGPMYPAVTTTMHRAANVELGDQVRLQHRDLIQEEVPIYVRRRRFSYANREITLVGRARTEDTLAKQASSDATTGTNSDDATAEELLTFAFATDDDGFLPDGSIGSRAR